MRRNSKEIFQGFKAGLPISAGYFPIAIAFGALAMEAGLTIRDASLMSVLVFAGASQFMAAGMFLAGAGGLQIIAATFFVNLRHFVMSLSVHHKLETSGRGLRALVSFGVTDETFAFLTLHTGDDTTRISPYFTIGLNMAAYLGWVSGTVVGCFSAQIIPAEISTAMTFGLYALFIGLLMPSVQKSRVAAVVAGVSMVLNTLLSLVLDTGWAMVLATILGAAVGAVVQEGEA
jgi:4-azaleucine resistance transporter AzlC